VSYTVLARRYRSRDFDEIVGQKPVVQTLKNAVENNRTAHAYLFCGTRGVGKTSMARILAKALNATEDLGQRDEVADAILRGEDLDVIEIDGASNRGVQEARDLIAGAGLSPSRCPYKIYIIDEVHMLTREAFNTLLKTMEEPPEHVKFILCTTEPPKVPATIQSRCQRFDFRPLTTAEIAAQLRQILDSETVEAGDDVVTHIARLGNGSMRDALSLLDRLLATGESPLTVASLEQMLGLPDQSLLLQLVSAIVNADSAGTLKLGSELLMRGSTEEQVLDMLAQHFRNLMILITCGADSELSDVSPDARDEAAQQAQHFDAPGLVHLITLCDHAARSARGSANARALFDAVLVRLSLAEHLADVTALLSGDGQTKSAKGSTSSKKKDQPQRKATPVADPPREVPAPSQTSQHPRFAGVAPDAAPTSAPSNASTTESTQPAQKPNSNPAKHVVEPKNERDHAPQPQESEPATELSGPELWQTVLDADLTGPQRRKVQFLTFESLNGRTLNLSITPEASDQARFLSNQAEAVADIVQQMTNRRFNVRIHPPQQHDASAQTETRVDDTTVKDDPVVAEAMDLFDAVVVNVRDRST